MKRIFISTLGTGKYDRMFYTLNGEKTDSSRKFAPVAIAEILKKNVNIEKPFFDSVYVFVTKRSREIQKEEFEKEWNEVIKSPQAQFVEIPVGKTEEELWQIFNIIGEKLKCEFGENDCSERKVIIDITHGFRMLPLSMLYAVQFYRNLINFEVEAIYYGALEAVDLPDGKKYSELTEEERRLYPEPVFNITPMFDLVGWSESIAEWKDTGRAKYMIQRISEFKKGPLFKDGLNNIRNNFEKLDGALRVLKSDVINEFSNNIVNAIDKLNNEIENAKSYYPLKEILENIKSDISQLGQFRIDKAFPDINYLKNQLNIIIWYKSHGRILEAYSFARELIISICIYLCLKFGVVQKKGESLSINLRKIIEIEVFKLMDFRFKYSEDEVIDEDVNRSNLDNFYGEKLDILKEWFGQNRDIADRLLMVEKYIRDNRNKFVHCWTGEAKKETFSVKSMQDIDSDLQKSIEDLSYIINKLSQMDS
jgi:CRISPR-associated DxTHG motif protein